MTSGKTAQRSVLVAVWLTFATLLASCGAGDAFSGALGGESKDTAEVLAAQPSPTLPPLDLQLDPAETLTEGTGDFGTLNRVGWPGSELSLGDYTVHAQCRGGEQFTFSYSTLDGSGPLTSFPCGAPQWFSVSAPTEGYFLQFNGGADDASGVTYIYAVTK